VAFRRRHQSELICRLAGFRFDRLVNHPASSLTTKQGQINAWPDWGSPNLVLRLAALSWILAGMSYIDPTIDSIQTIDNVRLTGFQRAGTRPSGKLRRPPSESTKALQRASGRLRQAAYRINLDRNKKPESNVVAMALLSAVVTQTSAKAFDAASVSIVTAAFADLQERGYERSEIEAVFRRFRKLLVARLAFASNE
jgi:hypothetical protein